MNYSLNQLKELVEVLSPQKLPDDYGGFVVTFESKGQLWMDIEPHNDSRRSVGSITPERLKSLSQFKGALYFCLARDEFLVGEGDRICVADATYVALESGRVDGNFQTVFAAKK